MRKQAVSPSRGAGAPLRRLNELGDAMRRHEPSFVMSVCREWRRPYLRHNVRRLEQCARQTGRPLLHALAARRLNMPNVDLETLEVGCARWLRGQVVDEPIRRFVERVLARAGEQKASLRVR